jgi:unsaturated rhamnogalacturonyl hydrolase
MERMTLPQQQPRRRRAACAFVLALLAIVAGCAAPKTKPPTSDKPWSTRMAESVVARHPNAARWELDDKRKQPKWSYATSFATYAVATVGLRDGEGKFVEYAKTYTDAFVDKDGKFIPKSYKPKDYKLDDMLPGRLLLLELRQTGEPRYRVAADTLARQLTTQPRTADGGYWHKKTYKQQMWLDGIFMDCPFMVEYAQVAKDPHWYDEAANQIVTIAKHTRDPRNGLYFHGWDESRTQRWANKQTGQSPHVWGRAVGWYFMGMVETLERLPNDHPRRSEVLEIFRNLAAAIATAQDASSGVWWQVMDEPGRKGNYLESSASCMFVYSMAKGVRLGLLDENYNAVARRGYDGIVERFIWADPHNRGLVSLTDTCKVAGLGGKKPYRDGSFKYYISEPRIANDPKGLAPFILASMEMERQ